MVLAFLRAEFDSPRFGYYIRGWLGGNRALIDDPDLDDVAENTTRKRALENVRGFGTNAALFTEFPIDAEWLRVIYTVEEVGAMKYANHPTWTRLSKGTRLVIDGAANVLIVPTAEGR